MDILSLLGVVLAFAAVLGGNFLEGGSFESLLNPAAAVVVFGGTLAAGALHTPMSVLRRALRRLAWILVPHKAPFAQQIGQLVEWAQLARRDGLLGLEAVAGKASNEFSRKGLRLLVDGTELSTIVDALELDSHLREQADVDAAKFYESMGGYAPTIGILGAVMGLIQVMGNLQDPSLLGEGIALAFVATIYGVAFANLFLLPIANKMRLRARHEASFRQMIIDGISMIAEGENPRTIERKLEAYSNQR